MFNLGEHNASDASVKPQSRTGPPSEKSANFSDGAVPGSKKRKRDENTMDDLLKDPFVAKPYPSHISAKPRTLQPLMLLPRSKLPLSFLDITASAKLLSQSRLFEAHVKILELEDRMGSRPMVLIARHEDTRILYAVERESRGLCAICQLGSWVSLQQLKDTAIASKQALPNSFPPLPLPQAAAPNTAGILDTTKYSQKKRLAIEALQSMVKRPTTASAIDPLPSQITTEVEPLPVEETVNPSTLEEAGLQLTSAEIFENVRTQYFETLYLSKASLAYFAKGPLSRARAAFHLDHDSTLELNDLINFLESIVMSTTLVDKKYRDGVPSCISLIDIEDHSADENKQTSGKTKKRKSTKKMKPGKNGLYPTEDVLIRRWWRSHDDDIESGPESTKEDLLKSRVSELRIRETQLQMIIILEVLALQPFASGADDPGSGLPAALPTIEVTEPKDKSSKTKKPDHLSVLIDVHIDRLCIWQSIASESSGAPLGDSQVTPENTNGSGVQSKNNDNVLRDFCIEVIAPFFSSRLPERCSIINRKLGGPIVVSPPKPRLSKSSSFSGSISRPGAATKRPVPVKPRRSLQSVLTEERERRSMSRGPNRAISLMRSATMPTIPGLKREASEAPSLSSIPTAEPFHANRGGVLNSKRFSQREVDLSNFGSDVNPKAKKQAMVDAELKEAISALKKPNRQLAGKELVETAEKRAVSGSHPKKSRKPVRNPLFQGVVISATPKSKRQKDFLGQTQVSDSKYAEDQDIPTSRCSMVPQSVSRSSQGLAPTRNPLFSSIQATPTRKPGPGSSLFKGGAQSSRDDFGGVFPSSPLHVRRSSAQLFSSVPDSAMKSSQTILSSQKIQDTPVKAKLDVGIGHAHPPFGGSDKENDRREGGQWEYEGRNEDSIYKALGWDDADELYDGV